MTIRRNSHDHPADVDFYGADDVAPFPGATWHYSDVATWPDHVKPAPMVTSDGRVTAYPDPRERRGPINTDSPAGQAFSRYCAGELNISAMSRLERDEFASVARMWLDTPAIANPRNPEDAPLPDFLRDFVAALEATPAPKTRTLKSSELRRGMVVWCSGMRCLIDGEIHSRESTQGKLKSADDWRVYWTVALVLNRDDVRADQVPLSFTQPRLSNGRADEAAIARGEHRWTIQGNDNARWCVESD